MIMRKIGRFVWWVCMLAMLAIVLVPVLYTISASFRTNKEIMTGAFSLIPEKITFDNYVRVWVLSNFARATWNSVYFSLMITLVTIVVVSMSSYVFARYEFPGKKIVFGAFASTMFVSLGSAGLFQTMRIADFLHLNGSLNGLIIITAFGSHITWIYIAKNYMSAVPLEVDEAAKIDGAGFYQIYLRIMLPLMLPILGAIGVLSFKGAWNNYLQPMLFTMTNPDTAPLAVALQALKSSGAAAANWDLQVAGSVITMLPIMVIFAAFNKLFTGGLAAGAVKG